MVSYELIINKYEATSGTRKLLLRNGKRLEVTIPAGVQTNTLVRLSEALQITDNCSGDIVIRIKVKEQPRHILHKTIKLIIPVGIICLFIFLGVTHKSSEEQEYNRVASFSERQSFQQSVTELRSQGFDINFGKQPPYRSSQSTSIKLENNAAATNPTWQDLKNFLITDQTDAHLYLNWSYTCGDFAQTLHNNAEKSGIRCAFVAVNFTDGSIGHAFNTFFTSDSGWVFIDNTGSPPESKMFTFNSSSSHKLDIFDNWSNDSIAYVKVGKELGFVHMQVADSLNYSFYEDWENRVQIVESELSSYNEDVKSYNNWIAGRIFYRGTPDGIGAQTLVDNLDARLELLKRKMLKLGPAAKPMGIVKDINIYF